jgi:hypothetical protein
MAQRQEAPMRRTDQRQGDLRGTRSASMHPQTRMRDAAHSLAHSPVLLPPPPGRALRQQRGLGVRGLGCG